MEAASAGRARPLRPGLAQVYKSRVKAQAPDQPALQQLFSPERPDLPPPPRPVRAAAPAFDEPGAAEPMAWQPQEQQPAEQELGAGDAGQQQQRQQQHGQQPQAGADAFSALLGNLPPAEAALQGAAPGAGGHEWEVEEL
jgi:hypothetical protein